MKGPVPRPMPVNPAIFAGPAAFLALFLPVSMFATEPYPGGPSPVSSSDPERATLAAARVKPLLQPELEHLRLRVGSPVFLRIFKESAELELWMQPSSGGPFTLFRTYRIARHSGSPGPKTREGDGQAPEGFYFVTTKSLNSQSKFHLSFDLGYPNEYDRAHERTGSHLMVHGKRVSIGCYAMTDDSIEQIYTLVSAALRQGQPFVRVHCFPFRFTGDRLTRETHSPWHDFWSNLRDGYLAFEESRSPPDIVVRDRRYVVR